MKTKKVIYQVNEENREVIQDNWTTELNTINRFQLTISWVGHMIASPTQFFTNFASREEFCIQYTTRGKGDFFTNSRLYTIKPGTLWLIPKSQYYYYISNKDDPYEYYWIHFSGDGAQRFLEALNLSETNPVIYDLHNPSIEHRFKKLIEISKSSEQNEHLILASLHRLFYEIETSYIKPDVTDSAQNERDFVVDNVISFIKDNYSKNITLQDLAKVACLNKVYLIKKFKLQTGFSPMQFLIQYRISQSCKLLHSNIPLQEVALLCGFHNFTNYLKRFKSFIGITPTQYRNSL